MEASGILFLGRKDAGGLLAGGAEGPKVLAVGLYLNGPGIRGCDGNGPFGLELFGETRTRYLVIGELTIFPYIQPHTGAAYLDDYPHTSATSRRSARS